jgi:DNA-binding NarL/FixJ family response regulator
MQGTRLAVELDGEASKVGSNGSVARILVVEDHPIVRAGLVDVIGSHVELAICGTADTLAEALRLVDATRPHLVILDLTLRDGSGLELVKDVHSRFPHVRMLVFSMHDEKLFAERALRAGAAGYLQKDVPTTRLLEAIQQVLDGRIALSLEMTDRILCRSVHPGSLADDPPHATLSDREIEVFELIGHGSTTRQIADRLDLSPKTIETYRENIKAKLNLRNGTELTCQAVQWVLEGGGKERSSV